MTMPFVTTTRGASLEEGEEALGVPAVHVQGLLLRHGGQVLHGEAVLGPVLEHGAIAPVGD